MADGQSNATGRARGEQQPNEVLTALLSALQYTSTALGHFSWDRRLRQFKGHDSDRATTVHLIEQHLFKTAFFKNR
jgi:hypothetical protein